MSGVLVLLFSVGLLGLSAMSYLVLGAAADARSFDTDRRRQHAIDAFATVLFAENPDIVGFVPTLRGVERDALIEVVSTLPIQMGAEGRERLRRILDTPSTRRAFARLKRSPRWSSRLDAARLCGLVGSSEDQIRLLADRHFAVRGTALAALSPRQLAEHADLVAGALLDQSSTVRTIAASVLPVGGVAMSIPLIAILDRTSPDRQAALVAAARVSDQMLIGALRRHGQCDHPQNRVLAAEALARQSPVDTEPILIEMLADTAPDVRAAAAAGLGRIGRSASLIPLRTRLSDEEWVVRTAAKSALAGIGPAGALLLRQQVRRRAELPTIGETGQVPFPAGPEERQRLQAKTLQQLPAEVAGAPK